MRDPCVGKKSLRGKGGQLKRKKNIFGFSSTQAPKGKYRAPGLIQTKRQRRVARAIRRARLYRPGALTGKSEGELEGIIRAGF